VNLNREEEGGVFVNIQLSDVTVHIDENLEADRRGAIEDAVRAIDGVISVHNGDDKPHLMIVQYDPAKTNSATVLSTVTGEGVHAELIGL